MKKKHPTLTELSKLEKIKRKLQKNIDQMMIKLSELKHHEKEVRVHYLKSSARLVEAELNLDLALKSFREFNSDYNKRKVEINQ